MEATNRTPIPKHRGMNKGRMCVTKDAMNQKFKARYISDRTGRSESSMKKRLPRTNSESLTTKAGIPGTPRKIGELIGNRQDSSSKTSMAEVPNIWLKRG